VHPLGTNQKFFFLSSLYHSAVFLISSDEVTGVLVGSLSQLIISITLLLLLVWMRMMQMVMMGRRHL